MKTKLTIGGNREGIGSIEVMSTETFVVGYKRHSQMDVNTINGVRLSSEACDMLEELYGIPRRHQSK